MSGEPWFRRWFGEEYLELYPHRDDAEARRAVALLVDRLSARDRDGTDGDPPGRFQVLDLACGAGRHLAALEDRGLRPVGLDLSRHLLDQAGELLPDTPLLRGDMRRLPFPDAAFRIVTSFFTSFGYFESEEDDRLVLREIRRVSRPGGFLLLDFLNAPRVRTDLTARDERTTHAGQVIQYRRLLEGGRRVEKRIRIIRPEGEESFTERVRLYDVSELVDLLEAEGVEPLDVMGDYEGHPHTAESPRAIIFARIHARSAE